MIINEIRRAIARKLKTISIPLTKRILFESAPDVSGNTYMIYKEMIKRNIDKDYKLLWVVSKDYEEDLNVDKVKYIYRNSSNLKDKIVFAFNFYFSKMLLFDNICLNKHFKNQISVYLTHGIPLKKARGYTINNECDYVISNSEIMNNNYEREFKVDLEKIVTLGMPRNDLLKKDSNILHDLNLDNYNKIILWMPTFRQHINQSIVDSSIANKIGLPIIQYKEQLKMINDYLVEHNSLLIIKGHPASKEMVSNNFDYASIKCYTDSDFIKKGYQLYDFVGKSDALISDYSSIYWDYLITGKMIGITIDDYDEYAEKRGFAIDNFKECIKGVYINDFESFMLFLEDVIRDHDIYLQDRNSVKEKYISFSDSNSTKRVVDFLVNYL